MPERPTHLSIVPPTGVRPARFRPPAGASSAGAVGLDGDWRFRLFDEAETGAAPGDDGARWDTIGVPGHWQLAGTAGEWPHGRPAYTNVLFPIPVDPPHVPRENPTGEYRRTFTVPGGWAGGRMVLRFEGVDSWFEVAVNGRVLAQSHGSRLPTEVDVTDAVRAGENLLAVRVTQWSAQTYVEDQDQWWLSGIFRSVTLEHRPDGGVEHVVVHADFDHTTGTGTLCIDVPDGGAAEPRGGGSPGPARITVPELGLDLSAGEEVSAAVVPWSAEHPRLYDAVVATATETVRLRVGFRRVAVVDGVFTVNGAPVKLRGMNRHEFEPTRGRAVTDETMLRDVLLMKRHHVNAVRTSHYPPHPHLLDLCDAYGLYVVDENDLETHGFEPLGWHRNPTDDPAWEDVLVDRVTRMVRRDAHHPSIVLWSLGNEAGTGRNLGAMARAIRELDPSRPLHYEGDQSCEHTDVYSRMYASTEEVALIGRGQEPSLPDGGRDVARRAMPFVQCEYVHAMGNGPGGLADYDALFDAHPRLMGGFVWEWLDHGIRTTTREGTEFYGYGGDFGEELHDGTFIADGMLLPDRTPTPGAVEMAAVYAPVRVSAPGRAGALTVRNRYAFRDTAHVRFVAELAAGGEVLASADLDVPVLAPGASVELTPDADALARAEEAGARADVWWTVRALQRGADGTPAGGREHEQEWAGEGFELGAGQVLLRRAAPLPVPADRGSVSRTDDGGYAVGPVRLDPAGRVVALGGSAVRVARVDAWRAPTDNDARQGWGEPIADAEAWARTGLTRLRERLDTVEELDGAVVVTGRAAGAATDCGFAVRYEWRPAGSDAADLTLRLTPQGRWPGSVARLGWLLALEQADAGDVEVDWVGRGPGESYVDSDRAALAGRWVHTVDELQTPYTHPQENGARRGVTRAELNLGERRLLVELGEVALADRDLHGFELTVRPWSDHALAEAAHPHELAPDGMLWLHLDAAQHGLGTAACGPGVLPAHRLLPVPVEMRLRLTV